jgi:hypothetical protein
MKKLILIIALLWPVHVWSQQPVTIEGSIISGTLQNAATADGNGTALTVSGMSTVIVTVNCASCSGGTTVNFEGTGDATNYSALNAVQLGTQVLDTTVTTSGVTIWEIPVAGLQAVRARISGYSAGTVTVTGRAVGVPSNLRLTLVNLITALSDTIDDIQISGSDDGGSTARRVKTTSDGTVAVQTQGANGNADIKCTNNAFLNMTTATTTEIVALSGSTVIYVCSFSIVSEGDAQTSVKFVSGTGTDCATSQADRSSGMILTAGATVGISRGSGVGMVLKSDAGGDALCVTQSGAANIGVDISYAQF